MSWATQRKIVYFLILVIILALIAGGLLYFFTRHPVTCFDGIQNQGEAGVDCGGPCSELCTASELSPVVLWSRVFTLAPGIYSAGAYVENPNATAEAFSVPYAFSFYDAQGKLLGTRTGAAFIPAGQNFVVIESNIANSLASSSGEIPARTSFQFSAPSTWQIAPTAGRDFNAVQVQNLKTDFSADAAPRVEADLVNISYNDLPRIDVSAILYDASGNAVGVSKTYVSSLPKQSSQHVVFTWIEPFSQPPARVELVPVVNESSISQY